LSFQNERKNDAKRRVYPVKEIRVRGKECTAKTGRTHMIHRTNIRKEEGKVQ